jgi:hypothetical protein
MSSVQDTIEQLRQNQRNAAILSESKGIASTRKLLEKAQRDLETRIRSAEGLRGPGSASFTVVQMRVTLEQVKLVQRELGAGMRSVLLGNGEKAAIQSAQGILRYLHDADSAFRGVGTQPLRIHEATTMDAAVNGAKASILRQIATSGTSAKNADRHEHRGKSGVLARYGVAVIHDFEDAMQVGLLAKKSWGEMRDDITQKSSFLKGKPAFWADRIVRTESMRASNAASFDGIRQIDEDSGGGMLKIISCVFDSRTAADSYAVHGEIRRPEEAFDTWYGLIQHPPDRPNDRGIVTPHNMRWTLPAELAWKTDADVAERWAAEGRKSAIPPRPLMTTVPLATIGRRA